MAITQSDTGFWYVLDTTGDLQVAGPFSEEEQAWSWIDKNYPTGPGVLWELRSEAAS
jgi:hypothetical protein